MGGIMTVAEQIMIEQEVADKLVVKKATTTKWRARGKGPPFLKIGSKVRYRLSDVEAWIESRRVVPGSAPKPRRSRSRRRKAA
jgi:excisionase family DNA binding protein